MTSGVLRCEMPQPSPPSASAEPRSSCRLASAMVIWKYKVMAPEPKPTSSIQKPIGTACSTVGYRAESAQREQDAGRPLAVAEVCEQQGVERDGKAKTAVPRGRRKSSNT